MKTKEFIRPKYWLVLVNEGDNGIIYENILHSTNNLEALDSVISFYASRVNKERYLEVREATTFDAFDMPDEYKVIKEVKQCQN